jgi:hypothetical protein
MYYSGVYNIVSVFSISRTNNSKCPVWLYGKLAPVVPDCTASGVFIHMLLLCRAISNTDVLVTGTSTRVLLPVLVVPVVGVVPVVPVVVATNLKYTGYGTTGSSSTIT